MDYRYSCPNCQSSRWKTVIKGKSYKCLNCGFVGQGVLKEHFKKSEERKRKKIEAVKKMYNELLDSGKQAKYAVEYIAHKFRIDRATVYRYLNVQKIGGE